MYSLRAYNDDTEEKGEETAVQNAFPNYYPQFHCIASECCHNCCIGWEIDVDAKSLKKYRTVSGAMGERLKKAIVRGKEPHFRLGSDERCPFLNSDNLCDLILYGGEEMLCQICTDHPRFRSFLPTRTEIGIGLCCEAAAKLILTQKEPFSLVAAGEAEAADGEEAALLALRSELFFIAQDRSKPISEREELLLRRCGVSLPELSAQEMAAFYLSLERLDKHWTELLTALTDGDMTDFIMYMQPRETEYEQLLCYFLYRHLPEGLLDGDIGSKAAFAVLSVRLLRLLGAQEYHKKGSFTVDDQVELARLYSAEVEYSQDNLDAIFDALC